MSVIEKPIEEERVEVPDSLPEVDPVTQALIDAKAYMMEHGWCQGIGEDHLGRVCTIGAMVKAADNSTAGTAINRIIHVIGPCVVMWNDNPKRKVEEVYEAFDKAIAYKE